MKNFVRCFLLFALAFLFCFSEAEAQRRYKYKSRKKRSRSGSKRSRNFSKFRGSKAFVSRARKFSYAGINLNAFNYYGDITPEIGRFKSDISFTRPGFGLHYGYQYKPYLGFRAEFNYGRLTGDDEKGLGPGLEARNLNFRNDIKELSLGVYLNFLSAGSANRRPPFNPYLFAALGVFHHNPQGELLRNGEKTGQWVELEPLGTEGQYIEGNGVEPYSLFQLSIPFGAGVKIRLPGNLDFSFEIGGRKLFFDHIDDVSGPYPDLNQLSTEARGFSYKGGPPSDVREGDVRGGPDFNDFFIVTQFKLSYIFGSAGVGRGKFR